MNKNVWILGELIHNSSVISELETLNIHTVNDLNSCDKGICIIRSHGMASDKIKEIQNQGFEIVDLTCPDVKKVQNKAVQLAKENYPVLIIGKREHPEVIAIKANASKFSKNVFVIQNIDELDLCFDIINKEKKAGIVVQTTQKIELLQEIVSKLLLITDEIKVFNTICKSTALRQNEARELAELSDLMFVVGGKNSANTTHLAEILKEITTVFHIETAADIDLSNQIIKNAKNIGVTAGASTPQNIIDDVIKKLINI